MTALVAALFRGSLGEIRRHIPAAASVPLACSRLSSSSSFSSFASSLVNERRETNLEAFSRSKLKDVDTKTQQKESLASKSSVTRPFKSVSSVTDANASHERLSIPAKKRKRKNGEEIQTATRQILSILRQAVKLEGGGSRSLWTPGTCEKLVDTFLDRVNSSNSSSSSTSSSSSHQQPHPTVQAVSKILLRVVKLGEVLRRDQIMELLECCRVLDLREKDPSDDIAASLSIITYSLGQFGKGKGGVRVDEATVSGVFELFMARVDEEETQHRHVSLFLRGLEMLGVGVMSSEQIDRLLKKQSTYRSKHVLDSLMILAKMKQKPGRESVTLVRNMFHEVPSRSSGFNAKFLYTLQELGWRPSSKNDKKFVRSVLRQLAAAEDSTSVDIARVLRTVVRWQSNDDSNMVTMMTAGIARDSLDLFYGKLLQSYCPPTFASFMFSFISKKDSNFTSDDLELLTQYVASHKCLGEIIDQSERKNRIDKEFLQQLCDSYMHFLLKLEEPCELSIADLFYSAAKADANLEPYKLNQLRERFLEAYDSSSGTKALAQMIYSVENLNLPLPMDFPLADVVDAFLASSRREGPSANEIASVLCAITNLSVPFREDEMEEVEGLVRSYLEQLEGCNFSNLLPALQAVRKMDSKLAPQVARKTVNVFDKSLRLASLKEVSEMLSTVAEIGYRPKKAQTERFLHKLVIDPNKCTSSELVDTMRALGKMKTNVNGATIDRVVYCFSNKLDKAETQELATFLQSLSQLNYDPRGSTLELLDRIDKHLGEM